MRLNYSNLRHLPVVTQSGLVLGKVIDFDFDAETHSILSYTVRGGLRDVLARREIIVAVSQVVSITKEQMVVRDVTVPVESETKAKTSLAPQAEGAAGVVASYE